MAVQQGLINHVALVLDASLSMSHLRDKVVQVADDQIAYLARRSRELDQETRVTVYVFSNEVECVVYDKDVLRLPSIKTYYRPGGMTALLAATLKSQRELAQTAQLYGDHSFLTFVLTDGQENASHQCSDAPSGRPAELVRMVAKHIETMPDNWTVAVLAPDQLGKREARQAGFPAENIAIWDSTSTRGLEEAGGKIQKATEEFLTNRASGIRGSRSVFSTGADAVNEATVKQAGMTPLDSSCYRFMDVSAESVMQTPQIRDWVENKAKSERSGLKYTKGCAFYQLTKKERIQPQKQVALYEKKTNQVYSGPEARSILGLGDATVEVTPDYNPKFSIFVQSTSVNRKLVGGTQLLLMV